MADVEARISYQGESQPCLVIYGYDWPRTWRIPEGIDPTNFEPDYDQDDGLEEFFKEVAPYLAEPLTIQAVGSEKCRFPLSACEWHILPGAGNVEINSFHHFDEEVHA